jgi:hypothetical protein
VISGLVASPRVISGLVEPPRQHIRKYLPITAERARTWPQVVRDPADVNTYKQATHNL